MCDFVEKLKQGASWVASFLFFCTLLVSFPSFASLLFLTGLLICLPLPAVQELLRERGLKLGMKVVLAVILMVVGAVLVPSERLERSSDARSVQEATQEEQTASETAQEPEEQEPQPEEEQQQVSTEELVNRMNAVIAEALGDEFSVSAEGNTITVDIWADNGTVTSALGAMLDIEGGTAQWDSMIETCKGFAEKLQTSVDSLGRSDVTVCVNLVNGDEHDHSLLSIARGEVLYNVATDYQNNASEDSSTEKPVEQTSESNPEPTAEELKNRRKNDIKLDLYHIVSKNYQNTDTDDIVLNDNAGTDDDNDYVALMYLTWDVKNTIPTTKKVIAMYSEDFAARVGKDIPEITDFAIFWTIPYHLESDTAAKYSYERRGNGMYETDVVWNIA